jgi:hypothetical protein
MNEASLISFLKTSMQAIAEEWPDIPKVNDLDDIDPDTKGSAWNRAYGRYWASDTVLQQLRQEGIE